MVLLRSFACLLAALLLASSTQVRPTAWAQSDAYSFRAPSRDGTGKVYMGREIAQVMGHLGAAWLERPERVLKELPDQVVEGMELAEDATVADIGAGTGYFSFRVAARVPKGRVYAVDIQPEMLAKIARRIDASGASNVLPVRGDATDPNLPEKSIDAVLMVDAYHEFSHPKEMMTAVMRALRPGGRVFLVEYRGEDPSVPIKPLHKMTEAQTRREMEAVGLRWVMTRNFLPSQHFLIFEKPRLAEDKRGASLVLAAISAG